MQTSKKREMKQNCKETIVNISDSWEKNWVYSEHPGKEFGKFVLSYGKFWNDPENDKGTWEARVFVSKI